MRNQLTDELQQEIKEKLGDGWSVEKVQMQKVGGVAEGFACRFRGDNYSVVIYPHDYKKMLNSDDVNGRDMANYLASVVREKRGVLPRIPKTPGEFRAGLFIQAIHALENQELLKD